jgi:ketosteroid isomerase-like protein
MTERSAAERIIRELHAARIGGDLAAMCRVFAEKGHFRIVGAGADKPISIVAQDLATFRPWLSMLVKVFRVTDYQLLFFMFEGSRATAHWRANIYSKITGIAVPTELVDLVEFGEDRIVAYSEFFVPVAP